MRVSVSDIATLTGTSLRNFDTEIDEVPTVHDDDPVVIHEVTVEVTATSEITATYTEVPQDDDSRRHLIGDGGWDWHQLQDYVVGELLARFGPFPRDPLKESGIFKRFVKQYGAYAEPIARFAFEVGNGYWKGSPVSVNRFCAKSDPYFAAPIAKHLNITL